jgi:hypothetical protein
VPLNRWREMPAVLGGAARYLARHLTWSGVDGSGLHRADPRLYRPFTDLVERHRLHAVSRRTLTYRAGYGYGFDDEVATVLYANLLRPRTFVGLALGGGAFMWQGGTQPIWERLARTLDVRTGAGVERIERHPDGVEVVAGGATHRFDALVITCDPRDALRVLDASAEERAWFEAVTSLPYSTFACEVRGLASGSAEVGYLTENMVRERPGHPMAWVKRYADQDVLVFHLFAPEALSDGDVEARIAGDVARLGGRLVSVRAARRWRFFPHFPAAFMQAGGLSDIARWQGTTKTYLIGEVLSFASLARVVELATRLADQITAGSGA